MSRSGIHGKRTIRSTRARRARRLAVAVPALIGIGSVLTACPGPTTHTTIDLRVRCEWQDDDPTTPDPPLPVGEFDVTIEARSPEHARSGDKFTFGLEELTGEPTPSDLPPSELWVGPAIVTEPTGLASWSHSADGIPWPFADNVLFPNTASTVTAPAGGLAKVNVDRIEYWAGTSFARCYPLAGEPTRLAAIEVR